MNFHKRLRKLQAKRDLTFKAIGKACGVTYQTVQQWAQDGGTYPKIENLEPLAEALNTTPWFLLFGISTSGEPSIKDPFPALSDEANELIQCVIRLDKDSDLARKTFALHTGLLLLQLDEERQEDAQAGLDSEGLTKTPAQVLAEAERIAQEQVASRDQSSRGKHAGTERGDS